MDKDNNIMSVSVQDLEKMWGENLSPYLVKKVSEYDLKYAILNDVERDNCLKRIVSTLLDKDLVFSGEHRHEQWNKGWGENLDNFIGSKDEKNVVPKYFGKYDVLRLKQKFIKPLSDKFEVNSLYIIQDWLFDKYFRNINNIYEFGCGTGHNLMRVREVNPTANLWGLDWADSSQKIIDAMRADGVDANIYSHNFDFFKPDYDFKIEKDSAIYTVAALEQIGDKHGEFINYLRQNKPQLCVHVEPIGELLDQDNLLDYLSVEYFKKRNYLNGYLDKLKEMESNGEIKILCAKRSYIGSMFIDGYSVIVWHFV
ncbi:MAG: hypothetical protein WC457_00775 [Patescibacteria group bacterium]